jgi:integrase
MGQYSRKLAAGTFWFYKFDFNGKTHKSKIIYHSRQEAKIAESKAYEKEDYKQRHPDEKPVITLLQAIDERLDYIKSRKTEKYYNDNKRYLNILYNKFGDSPLQNIKKLNIEKLLQEESSRGVYTVNSMLRCFKALFNYAIDSHELEITNPCLKIRPYAVEKRVKYIPTNYEIQTLLESCTEPQRRLIEFIRDTGARISEALNLHGRDVTNIEVTLYTRKSANSNLTARTLPKPDCLVGLTLPRDKKVFGDWMQQPKFLERKLKKLGLKKWGFHNLRHRFASIESAKGTPIYEISRKLGHSSTETTEIYLQLLPKSGYDLGTETLENKAI